MKIKWDSSTADYIKENAGKLTDEAIAKHLSKVLGIKISTQSIRKQRKKLGIQKKPGRGKCEIVEQKEKDNSNSPTLSNVNYRDKPIEVLPTPGIVSIGIDEDLDF